MRAGKGYQPAEPAPTLWRRLRGQLLRESGAACSLRPSQLSKSAANQPSKYAIVKMAKHRRQIPGIKNFPLAFME